ncbi:MAG: YopX family protein [Clostridia bacterium]|nr:YopX family protein [Clostridia bacterium]
MKYRIWIDGQMYSPESMMKTSYRIMVNADGELVGMDLSNMKWDGCLRSSEGKLMVSTGLKDATGQQDIYVGDVVRWHPWRGSAEWCVGNVVYDQATCSFRIQEPASYKVATAFSKWIDYEILGNVYEPGMQQLLEEVRKRREADMLKEAT